MRFAAASVNEAARLTRCSPIASTSARRCTRASPIPGEHAVIVGQRAWDKAHAEMDEPVHRRGAATRAHVPALPEGTDLRPNSGPMSPSYYICLGASRRGHDTCTVRSIAASEVEVLVLGQVRGLLALPQLVAWTITAVRCENGAAEDTELDEGDVIEALGALEPVWAELYPAEQARIMRLLIERIDVAPDGISVTLHAAGIRSLVAELADQEAPALAASEPVLEAAG
jgi:site-specific DNA recombinase